MRRRAQILTLLTALLVTALAYGIYYGIRWPLQVDRHWQIVDQIRLSRPDSLLLDADGRLRYVTLETIPGFLVELTPDGPKTVFGDFGEPDGALLLDDAVVVTEEDTDGRVLLYHFASARLRVLARLDHPEGLLRQPDGRLVVAQDMRDGKLLEIADDGSTRTLVDGLNQPEG